MISLQVYNTLKLGDLIKFIDEPSGAGSHGIIVPRPDTMSSKSPADTRIWVYWMQGNTWRLGKTLYVKSEHIDRITLISRA